MQACSLKISYLCLCKTESPILLTRQHGTSEQDPELVALIYFMAERLWNNSHHERGSVLYLLLTYGVCAIGGAYMQLYDWHARVATHRKKYLED